MKLGDSVKCPSGQLGIYIEKRGKYYKILIEKDEWPTFEFKKSVKPYNFEIEDSLKKYFSSLLLLDEAGKRAGMPQIKKGK